MTTDLPQLPPNPAVALVKAERMALHVYHHENVLGSSLELKISAPTDCKSVFVNFPGFFVNCFGFWQLLAYRRGQARSYIRKSLLNIPRQPAAVKQSPANFFPALAGLGLVFNIV